MTPTLFLLSPSKGRASTRFEPKYTLGTRTQNTRGETRSWEFIRDRTSPTKFGGDRSRNDAFFSAHARTSARANFLFVSGELLAAQTFVKLERTKKLADLRIEQFQIGPLELSFRKRDSSCLTSLDRRTKKAVATCLPGEQTFQTRDISGERAA